ncbi:MAG: N-acetyltransferase [Candidatus Thorarchaeota archaeon]|nr:N-acetyltransferase [Candidatus Thorarchaeota archaeon]
MSEMTEEYYAHPLAVVDDGADIGEGTKIWHFAHVRGTAKLGKSCNLGKGVYIDADVEIGDNVKIQNGVSVYNGVKIEDDVFCGPHMVFTNDLYPRAFSESWEVCETLVKEGASIGANAVIICNTVLGEYCMIGSGSVVTKDVPAHGLVMGNPGRLVGFVCICGQPLHDEIEKNADEVVFRCAECNQETIISASDYALKVR